MGTLLGLMTFDGLLRRAPAYPRWRNPAHHSTPIWKLVVLGGALGVGSMGFCELLLRAAA